MQLILITCWVFSVVAFVVLRGVNQFTLRGTTMVATRTAIFCSPLVLLVFIHSSLNSQRIKTYLNTNF